MDELIKDRKMEAKKSRIITFGVFGFTLAVVTVNLITLIFPALLVTSIIGSQNHVNSFEIGAWASKFFSINLSILIFGLLYYRKILPFKITKLFKSILNFEVSRKISIIVFTVIIGIYIIFTIPELNQQEIDVWKDWQILGPIIEEFPYGGDNHPALKVMYVNNFLLYTSQEVFQNVKVISFFGSLSLIFLTYFLTLQISKKRFAALVAVAILLQSHTFLRYDTTATFSNFWVLFYLLSLYAVYKKWQLSPLIYLASIFSKALTISFLPMTLFFIYRSSIAKKIKIFLTISFVIIFIVILGMVVFSESLGYSKTLTSFEFEEFVSGFTAWAFQLRIDGLVLVFLLPLTIGLFIKSRQGLKQAESILLFIGGILLSAPLLAGFSEFNIQPYRWIPLITFFAIGVGILFSKVSIDRSEK